MGEAKKREQLSNYYLGLDFRECDSNTIELAEKFFSEEYDREVFIIPEENKICMEDEIFDGEKVCRYKLERENQLWLADFEDDIDYDIKPYGVYWISFMKETFTNEYLSMMLNGQLHKKAESINIKTRESITERRNELLKQQPYQAEWNIFDKEKHLNMLEEISKELILSEIVYNEELYRPSELNYDEIPI